MRKLLLTAAAVAALCLAGCEKKLAQSQLSEPRAISEAPDTLTDTRDGKRYKIVEIAGKTWMAENLNYKTPSGSFCYNVKDSKCGRYGRLYDWKTALTACPAGWRLPSREEWGELIVAAGDADGAGYTLKSARGWHYDDRDRKSGGGADDYGFSALPGGRRDCYYAYFNGAGAEGSWWTATEKDGESAQYIDIDYFSDAAEESDGSKTYGFSVRCLQDGGGGPPDSAGRKTGYLTDSRDGRQYRTVKIGRQTWMAENLNYQPQTGESRCHKDDDPDCGEYGRRYDWKTAAAVCPAGWRLPSRHDWNDLMRAAGGQRRFESGYYTWRGAGNKLKSKNGWSEWKGGGGTDDYGFSAIAGGETGWHVSGIAAYWWTATAYKNGDGAYSIEIGSRDEAEERLSDLGNVYSVRCVQEYSGDIPSAWVWREKLLEKRRQKEEQRKKNAEERKKTAEEVENESKLQAKKSVGHFTDPRDGRKYRTVTIDGKTWMAENLNYTADSSRCYNNDTSYCDKYGRLYAWGAALTACPAGWHLSSRGEWDNLGMAAGDDMYSDWDNYTISWEGAGKTLKSTSGWNDYDDENGNGADGYGFSALPGGDLYFVNGNSNNAGGHGNWWTASESDGNNAYYRNIRFDQAGMGESTRHKSFGLSVRCLQNNSGGGNKADNMPKIEMVYVKGGKFEIGCTDEQEECAENEFPPHPVKVGSFYIGKYEVTQKQWSYVTGSNPSKGELGEDLPVNNVSWYDVQEFIGLLNKMTKKKYRLPTDAEWEFAARGGVKSKGTMFAGSNNIDDVAWHGGNSGGGTHTVGTKAPNELGIYDMLGNVWEWVNDWHYRYDESAEKNPKGPAMGIGRINRGGGWLGGRCRISVRDSNIPASHTGDMGFRLAVSP